MAELSHRIQSLVPGGDDGWSLFYRARALRSAGEPLVMLTIGDHDIPTDARILEAMKASLDAGNLGYASVPGQSDLRAAIAARVSARSATAATPAEIAVTPGGQAALFASLTALLDPGQSCVVLDPYYATYVQTVHAVSGRAILVATRAEQGFQPEADRIEAALAPDTRAILINTPNNPTGVVYGPARLEALADLCRRRDLWLISDEVYATQVWQGVHLSPRDLPGMAERCLVVDSLSKSHAMTGSRLGWIVGPEPAVAAIWDLSTATNYGQPGFIQDAATYALTEAEAGEAEVRERYARRRRAALDALGQGPGFTVVPPEGGMYVMLDIRATGLSGNAFARTLLEEARIAVMPGESFGAATAGHVRIALTVPEAELTTALATVAAFANARAQAGAATAG